MFLQKQLEIDEIAYESIIWLMREMNLNQKQTTARNIQTTIQVHIQK